MPAENRTFWESVRNVFSNLVATKVYKNEQIHGISESSKSSKSTDWRTNPGGVVRLFKLRILMCCSLLGGFVRLFKLRIIII